MFKQKRTKTITYSDRISHRKNVNLVGCGLECPVEHTTEANVFFLVELTECKKSLKEKMCPIKRHTVLLHKNAENSMGMRELKSYYADSAVVFTKIVS